ncbi:DUF1206 domain-containing protein [Candidatus Gracilibacteria bacterium]|nr:DUF1206 domain-containing protein [Candidatus Gracilibacteria bacterium]
MVTKTSATAQQQLDGAVQEAGPWLKRLGRLGYATKGVIYVLVGVLAAAVAVGVGGATPDTESVLYTILGQPFGRWLLGLVAVGLFGYAVWRVVEALVDPFRKGSDLSGIGSRAGAAFSGLAYGALGFTAMQLALGLGDSGGDAQRDWTARLLAQPFGRWLVYAIGLGVIGYGLYEIYRGAMAKFLSHLRIHEMSKAEQAGARWAGRIGYIARGIVFVITGGFFFAAAQRFNPEEVRGLAGALDELARQPFGSYLLAAVALGLLLYGVYLLSRRVIAILK